MKVYETEFEGLLIIEPIVFKDERGFFFESFHKDRYRNNGIPYKFVQDNRSRSFKGVLRGLHFQQKNPQGKLVSVVTGEVLDVALDLRPGSSTFGMHHSELLSGENNRQMFIPPGFAHGFVAISPVVELSYKCTDYYDKEDESGIVWNDEELAIDWNINNPVVSEKDKKLMTFSEYKKSV